ncbi:uridine phosphorylase [Candidatus Gottesmanbacteria bacterium RIFCSPHIGHO2_01_FULL_46_14]|uniref:Uridine phosphorylase n=2 Tax=Candidatus Gottesmaniibacteriota TaxID=1752720 RepID=A0A1F5ZPZ4_9BACT|nr:MAG: uridine phosphorylase [Candidatus Gottesmanbacteria bacterium RIFCSPHIGHO2_01_FULL_46_14]OGG29736.1 MAG: uridine phosphorylase [Candidatus Gottesmanbacteria bacterium RIFCSPLOWO2_01_FULL_46_21]
MKQKISAKAPVIGGKQYHIECGSGDVAPFVLVPGDPARVGKIASLWDSAREVANHREYHTMTGKFQGVPITCTSSGIGGPSLAIAVDELCRIGVDTFIRVGSTGGIQKGQKIGDLVISTAAVRLEGTSKDFVIPEYPAVASYEVVMALIEAAEELKVRYHVGITASTDTFYTGQGRPAYENYFPSFKEHVLDDMQSAGVQNFEMEAATLFTMASIFGKRAGAVCCIIANRVTDEFRIDDEMQKRAGLVASRAVAILHGWDKKKKFRKKDYLYPGVLT